MRSLINAVPEPDPHTMHSPLVWKRTLPRHVCTGTFDLAHPSLPERKPWDTREGAEAEAGDTGPSTLPGVWALDVIQTPAPWRRVPRVVEAGSKPCA